MKRLSQSASLTASLAAMYSALVVDSATMFCRFDDQEIGPPARVNT